MSATTDMTGGLYRRIYAGFLLGRRINSVSIGAEAWFWRLHAISDDFGNLHGDPVLLQSLAAPRRKLDATDIVAWTAELADAKLIYRYEISGESYLHIDGFEARQPAGRNGKRIQKCPPQNVKMGNIGGIQNNPGESGNSQHTIPIPIPIPTLIPPSPPSNGEGGNSVSAAPRMTKREQRAAAKAAQAAENARVYEAARLRNEETARIKAALAAAARKAL